MKTYYIYHIPGIKIGCTNDLINRMKDQGFAEWEVLEVHTDGWLAGDREQELQKQYSLPVDKVHYMISYTNRRKFSKEDMSKGGKISMVNMRSYITKETLARGGRAGKGKILKRIECPYCGKIGAINNMSRWHFNNCKQKRYL